MTTETQGRELHDRASRGMTLSAVEQKSLEDWYRRHDEDESRLLTQRPSIGPLDTLRADVTHLTSQLRVATDRIEVVMAQNDELRRENERLHRQLQQQSTASGT